ncbi:MAG: amino acid racemase [Ramlibacter sp.]
MLVNALGVLGGMGPLAAADFLAKLTAATDASCDQEHIPLILYGDCTTPDRTASILGQGPSPLPQLLAGIEFLNAARCAVIAIPCNSAHCWYEDMARASRAPVLHIVEASAQKVQRNNAATRRVGVLSTEGTHRMGIYRASLERMGFEVLAPTPEDFHDLVSPGIADIKGNRIAAAQAKFDVAADRLLARGAEQIILGWTEIPLGMQRRCAAEPNSVVDSTLALVEAVLAHFGATRKAQPDGAGAS